MTHSTPVRPRLYKVSSAADYLQISRSEVYAMLARGDLVAIKIGRATRIAQDDIDAWIDERRAQARDHGR